MLNCPEPLKWQQAFHRKELEAVFRYSTAFEYTLDLGTDLQRNTQCVLCFRDVNEQNLVMASQCCGFLAHSRCQEVTKTFPCILHSSALTKMGSSREASVDTWLSRQGSSPLRFSDDQIFNSQPREPHENGNYKWESSSDDHHSAINYDEEGLANEQSANRSAVEFFEERSRVSLHSPSVASSASSSAGPVAIKQEPESPSPSPRRQMPSRAAKEVTRARPDAYTGSPPRKQALTLVRSWSPKVSTTPIPLPVIPGLPLLQGQPVGGSQPARLPVVENPVQASVIPASAQGKFGRSRKVAGGSPLRHITTEGASPSSAPATARSVSGFSGSAISLSREEASRSSSFHPSPALHSPPLKHEVNSVISFPIPPTGATFASVSIPGTEIASSLVNNKKKKKTNPKKKRAVSTTPASAVTDQARATDDQIAATSTSPETAAGTTAHQSEVSEVKASKRERRKARLIKRMSRLEEDSEKIRKTKKYVEKELARLEKKKSKVAKKMAKLLETERGV